MLAKRKKKQMFIEGEKGNKENLCSTEWWKTQITLGNRLACIKGYFISMRDKDCITSVKPNWNYGVP